MANNTLPNMNPSGHHLNALLSSFKQASGGLWCFTFLASAPDVASVSVFTFAGLMPWALSVTLPFGPFLSVALAWLVCTLYSAPSGRLSI